MSDKKLRAVSGGRIYNLNQPFAGVILTDIAGLGIANINRLSTRAPGQHGETDDGFITDSRLITLGWAVVGNTLWELETLRQRLYTIFRPRDATDPVQLQVILPSGRRRQADVHLVGQFDAPSQEEIGYGGQRLALAVRAADPRLYNPVQQSLSFSLGGSFIAGGWDIEEPGQSTADGWNIEEPGQSTADGWRIGISALDAQQSINYAGGDPLADVEYPVIRVNGPLAAPVITNVTTGETIALTAEGGLEIPAGGYVEIDLRQSVKTILDQDGNSVDSYLSADSDLAGWHLSYATELLPDGNRSTGVNIIRVSGTGVTAGSSVDIFWYERFIGA